MRAERVAGSLKFSARKVRVSKHLAASSVRWDDRQRLMATREKEAPRNVKEVDNEINQNWTAAYQLIAKRMLKCLEDSEALKENT